MPLRHIGGNLVRGKCFWIFIDDGIKVDLGLATESQIDTRITPTAESAR